MTTVSAPPGPETSAGIAISLFGSQLGVPLGRSSKPAAAVADEDTEGVAVAVAVGDATCVLALTSSSLMAAVKIWVFAEAIGRSIQTRWAQPFAQVTHE